MKCSQISRQEQLYSLTNFLTYYIRQTRFYLPWWLPLLYNVERFEFDEGTNSWIPERLSFFSWVEDVKFVVFPPVVPDVPPIPSNEALDDDRLRPEKFLLISLDPVAAWLGAIGLDTPCRFLSELSCGWINGPCIEVLLWRGCPTGCPRSGLPWHFRV